MKNAIEKAITAGYPKESRPWCQECGEDYFRVLLDPLFWQALGKAMGWEDECDKCGTIQSVIDHEVAEYNESVCKLINGFGDKHIMFLRWKSVWHNFIDHLAEGGDVEAFFNQLLK